MAYEHGGWNKASCDANAGGEITRPRTVPMEYTILGPFSFKISIDS